MHSPVGPVEALVLGILTGGAIAGWSAVAGGDPSAEDRDRELGAALYGMNQCEGCHEVAYAPGQTVYRLDGLSKRHTVESLAAYLARPLQPMPRFELSMQERRALARYLLATFP